MKCRRAQSEIALWAGNDLDEAGQACLRRHLETCPSCRCYLEEMQLLMRLVDECPLRDEGDEVSKRAVEESLWPSLSTRLVTLSSPRSDRFNGWIPAVTVAAVCLAMVLIASPPRMVSPQEAPAYSSAEEHWPASHASADPSAPSALPKSVRPPIPRPPVDVRRRPRVWQQHPMEKVLRPQPALSELNGPFEDFPDPSDPWGPVLYMRIE